MHSISGLPPLEWSWYPSVLVGLALFSLAYALLIGPLRTRFFSGSPVSGWRQAAFYAGVLLVFLALCSPLDELGDEALFSAHMLQHTLLIYFAPLLWLLGVPGWLALRLAPAGRIRRAASWLISPLPAFLIANAVLWGWHIPAAYNLTLLHEPVHILEHLTFLASGLIAWAVVLIPAPLNPLSDPPKAVYLFVSGLSCTAMAALFTFAPQVLYPFYLQAPRITSLAPLADQQLGGIIMWFTGDLIFVLAILLVLANWLTASHNSAEV